MVGNSGHLSSALGARALLWLFPEWRENSPQHLSVFFIPSLCSRESHLLGDLASKMLWSWGRGGGGDGWGHRMEVWKDRSMVM